MINITLKKETQCSRCMHKDVCKYKEEMIAAQENIDSIQMSDILKPIELQCNYFLQRGVERLDRVAG